jgi:cytochrome b561
VLDYLLAYLFIYLFMLIIYLFIYLLAAPSTTKICTLHLAQNTPMEAISARAHCFAHHILFNIYLRLIVLRVLDFIRLAMTCSLETVMM